MTLEAKIRTLAQLDPTLVSIFGSGPFRWMDRRLQPGYVSKGTCVRLRRISTVFGYTNAPAGLMNLNQPRVQIDVLDLDATTCRSAAQAVINWLGTVSFAETNDFDSPATTPPHSPNFLLNHRAGMEAQPEGGTPTPSTSNTGPVYVETLDYRIYNLEN